MFDVAKRLLVGRPLRSERLGDTLLPKWLALPVFCSDPISSVAYATEQILLIARRSAGPARRHLSTPVAAAVASLLDRGGRLLPPDLLRLPQRRRRIRRSARRTSARRAALIAAAALLVDYVMTVAVSVVAGVVGDHLGRPVAARRTRSASRSGSSCCIALVNLRGVKESGRAFAIPTYASSASSSLLAVAAVPAALGHGGLQAPTARTDALPAHRAAVGGIGHVFLALRAFASRLHRADRRRGDQQRRAGVPQAQEPQRRAHAA